jgi:peptidoglycan/LPS O-acetylase OafA/YrhL
MRGLTHPWFVYGGTISYSIYLVHAPLLACCQAVGMRLNLVTENWLADAWLAASIAAVIPASIAAYAWIERPANVWILNRWMHPQPCD